MAQTRVHILSDGFRSPNAAAFVYPTIVHDRDIAAHGIMVKRFETVSGDITDSDVLIVDSKHFSGPERGQLSVVQDELARLSARCACLCWYDSTDSAGWIVSGVLPLVRRYFKNQVLRDRSAYLRPMYGRRAYTDFYHCTEGVTDREPEHNAPVGNVSLVDKIRIGWNSGFADYSRFGPARMALFRRLGVSALLARRRGVTAANAPRLNPVSCRMGVAYARETVSYQRRRIRERLARFSDGRKLRRGAYFEELRESRVVISPFGLGEITLKDFEVFLTGGLLVKPNMAHLETWPDLYRDGETMLSFKWDLSDLDAVIESALSDPARATAIAAQGQTAYLHAVNGADAGREFAERFATLVGEALAASTPDRSGIRSAVVG